MSQTIFLGGMTHEEYRRALWRHRFINSPTFERAVAAANRKIHEIEAERKREATISQRINWNPRLQRQLDKVRKEIRTKLEPYIDKLIRR
jgi:hypothetical protein